MAKYIIRRLLYGLVTIWLMSIISFGIIQLPPGDFVSTYAMSIQLEEGTLPGAARLQAMRDAYALDQPLPMQYLKWATDLLHGDLKYSLDLKRPVLDIILDRLPITAALSAIATLLGIAISIPLSVLMAMRKYSKVDYGLSFIAFLASAIPDFMLALIVLYSGFVVFHLDPGPGFSAVSAILILTLGSIVGVRIGRANLLDELNKPYVVTARAKGLTERRLVYKYPFRIAMNPFVSTVGYLLPAIVSGSVIVSLVLNLPNLGPVLLRALTTQDMFLAGDIVLLLGVLTVIGTLLSDLALAWVDPRIRLAK